MFPILGDKEILIKNENKQLGNRRVSVDVVSEKSSLVEDSIILASGYVPDTNYKYLTSKTTTERPLQNSVSCNLNFIFFD